MAKNIIGIDIGYNQLKLVQMQGKTVRKTAAVPMPEGYLMHGRITSADAMGELIRDTMRRKGMHGRDAAVILPGESIFVRNLTMPIMTISQLEYNLPYEFRDYIAEDLNGYLFDYAMLTEKAEIQRRAGEKEKASSGGEKAENKGTMDLIAAAFSREMMEDVRRMTRRAGLNLWKAAPVISAYTNLLRQAGLGREECCILDLGYHSTRMYMFDGERYNVTRELEWGSSELDRRVAKAWRIDPAEAHERLLTNYGNCQESEICREAYSGIAVEMMRAVNFYQFSNVNSNLQTLYLSGGGSRILPLTEEIRRMVPLSVYSAVELLREGQKDPDYELMIPAIGIALD